ncbi:MAG: hypothetical protein ABJB76_06020 [Candidatus Nitrosocosmicus sp.]
MKNGDQSKLERDDNIYYAQSKNVSMISNEEKNIIVSLDGDPGGRWDIIWVIQDIS